MISFLCCDKGASFLCFDMNWTELTILSVIFQSSFLLHKCMEKNRIENLMLRYYTPWDGAPVLD